MKITNARITFFLIALIVFTMACGFPSGADSTSSTVTPDTTEAPIDSAPPTDAPIQHTVIPLNLPDTQSGQAGDFDASTVLSNGSYVGGDRFTFARFERPFNAHTMDIYFSQLDIVEVKVFQDDIWLYASIFIKELSPSSSSSEKYAVEIDVNIDGKGDWLIIGFKPESTEWTVNGVQVFQDTNKDVGLELPTLTDEDSIGNGDGFETKVFDQGQGNDPDSAWVRLSPNSPNTIEFAIKQSVLENPTKFLINMWAGTSLIDPTLFDINDQFSHEQAGAADAGLPNYYPIKEVAEIDNSCRMAVGFQPTGNEPGLCEYLIPVIINDPFQPGPTSCARPTSCSGCGYTWDQTTCTCTQVPC